MIEAMKLALEALELCDGAETADGVVIYTNQEITSLRQAIAEAEKQEPVAWVNKERNTITWDKLYSDMDALYAMPQCTSLTDEQKEIINFLLGASDIDDVWFGDKHPTEKGQFWWRNRLRKAFQEAAHGIKE